MTMRKHTSLGILVLAVAACGGLIWADCGSIPMRMVERTVLVDVFEPNQRAVIAWNGKEEILILSTDLQASEATKVLEVIPMPSEPRVTQGDSEVFKKAVDFLNSKVPPKKVTVLVASGSTSSSGGGAGGGVEVEEPPAAEITFHDKIGASDISVVHCLSQKGFIKWVEDYLKSQNVKNPVIPEIMKRTVDEYIADGIDWFAFNVVSLDQTVKSKEAVQYRFKTDRLFYPMRISRTDKGESHVALTILTTEAFDDLTITGVPEGRLKCPHGVFTMTGPETRKISPVCDDLLGQPTLAKLRVWETTGKLASFDEDIVTGPARTFTLKAEKTGTVYGPARLRRNEKIPFGLYTLRLVVAKEEPGAPFRMVIKQESGVVGQSQPFQPIDGAKIAVGGKETFILNLVKPPVAKDPAALAKDPMPAPPMPALRKISASKPAG